jgi:hypothetical protein
MRMRKLAPWERRVALVLSMIALFCAAVRLLQKTFWPNGFIDAVLWLFFGYIWIKADMDAQPPERGNIT